MDSKSNKSLGMDQINVELIKYSPEILYEKVADKSTTGKYPNEITRGILPALQNSLTNNPSVHS